jgi:hypothetical protein
MRVSGLHCTTILVARTPTAVSELLAEAAATGSRNTKRSNGARSLARFFVEVVFMRLTSQWVRRDWMPA